MIIFWSILNTFESSSIFGGSWGSIENLLRPKIKTTMRKFSLPKSVKRSVDLKLRTILMPNMAILIGLRLRKNEVKICA